MRIVAGFFAVLSLFLGSVSAHAGPVPRQIAGIVMGARIDQYRDMLRTETALPVRRVESLTEVELKPMEGYQSGSLTYGNCENPGRIIKVKLRYDRDDKDFFEELFKRFKERFGETSEYKGDPFRMFLAWKWSFTDGKGNRVSLILQHNSMDDDDFPSGNVVKISHTTEIEKERRCFERTQAAEKDPGRAAPPSKGKGQEDFSRFIPE
jgi:hypothetical protein